MIWIVRLVSWIVGFVIARRLATAALNRWGSS